MTDEMVMTKVAQGGRIVIPAEMRKLLGIEIGEEVGVRVDGGELRISTRKAAFRRAQELVQKRVPRGVSLVDQLIAERRKEAGDE
jgi:AbrB family looped-hinge helix DNA binding protein